MQYRNEPYFKEQNAAHFEMTPYDVRSFGDALWYTYDYRVDKGERHRADMAWPCVIGWKASGAS